MFYKKIKLFAVLFLGVLFASPVFAQLNFGLEGVNGLGLSATVNPQVAIVNMIRIFLSFLGIIGVIIVLYAGWMWMTSAGEPEKINKAKKILISAVIGLLIIISAFGIVTYAINALTGAINGSVNTPICLSGETANCGCGGIKTCTESGSWGTCVGSDCSSNPGGTSCDGNPLTPSCDSDESLCNSAEYCDETCHCVSSGNLGESCLSETCVSPDAKNCAIDLHCSPTSCTCEGNPIIEKISPMDESDRPNGAPGNFITISGRFFGATAGEIKFWDGSDFNITAPFPNIVNPACTDFWTNNQVIVVVPENAADGPIKLIRSASQPGEDTTDNPIGNNIKDFDINTNLRPGLCQVAPDSGFFQTDFTLQGAALNGNVKTVKFGNTVSSTTADNISAWSLISVKAVVPNINQGLKTIFVEADGEISNFINYKVLVDNSKVPFISYIDAATGTPQQYITIYGGNFSGYDSYSKVLFTNLTSEVILSADGLDFPLECQDNWWHDKYIIVKVPATAIVGNHGVTVVNRFRATSSPHNFEVFTGTPPPGICKLDPANGNIGMQIRHIYGDQFTETTGKVLFFDNKEAISVSSWANQDIKGISIPVGAISGPLRVVAGGRQSNGLPFTVGLCTTNNQCDTNSQEICCASGTLRAGICSQAVDCDRGGGLSVKTGYGWSFMTGKDTTSPPQLTCSDWSGGQACPLNGVLCPNSPGVCATTPSESIVCSDSECNSKFVGSQYDSAQDKCKTTAECHAVSTTVLSGYTAECKMVGSNSVWQISSRASCPDGSYRDINGMCTVGGTLGIPKLCSLCANGFMCINDFCYLNEDICPGTSSCSNEICNSKGSCDCCCRVDDSPKDCCLGTTCEDEGCGNDGDNYGLCTGCTVKIDGVASTTLSDLACNCDGHTNKFCDTTAAEGLGQCKDSNAVCGNNIRESGEDCDDENTINGDGCDSSCHTENNQNPHGSPGDRCEKKDEKGMLRIPKECDLNVCPVDYGCLTNPAIAGDCGLCCCNPLSIPPQKNAYGLQCVADKSPCGGNNRGLYCGCKTDDECGSIASIGCGLDTCCRPKPRITKTIPQDEAENICRNASIEVNFNQLMDISSFTGNFILLADYGADSCPAGTYLSQTEIPKNLLQKIAAFLQGFVRSVLAHTTVDTTHNYCAVKGFVSGKNISSATSTLSFSPVRPLDPDKLHYGVIIGEGEHVKGVKSSQGLSLDKTSEIPFAITPSVEFNSVVFKNSYIFSFRTLSDSGPNDGFCLIDHVEIHPSSYLFQTNINDLNENDSDSGNKTFDTVSDSDKAYYSSALALSGQPLAPLPEIYEWIWTWDSNNDAVAALHDLATGETDKKILRVIENIEEGQTMVSMLVKPFGMLSSENEEHKAEVPAYIMLCDNPWPAVSGEGWQPWIDSAGNCFAEAEAEEEVCKNMNFEFYYCRDSGEKKITTDDLPAILNKSVNRGESNTDGMDLLKEYYFFREKLPSAILASLNGESAAEGGVVKLWWDEASIALGESLREYKIYYGTRSGAYTSSSITTTAPSEAAPFIINDLINGQNYYFAYTVIYQSGAESAYSNEIVLSVKDTAKLEPPVVEIQKTTPTSIEIKWNAIADAAYYTVYWKAGSGCDLINDIPPACYGGSTKVEKTILSAKIPDLNSGTEYFFALTATDFRGNQSGYSNQVSALPSAPPPVLSIKASTTKAITVSWQAIADAVYYTVYWKADSGCSGSNPPNCYASSVKIDKSVSFLEIADLDSEKEYFFALTATYGDNNKESEYSNEVFDRPKP